MTEDSEFTDADRDAIIGSITEEDLRQRSQALSDAQESWEEVAYLHNAKMPCPECSGAGSISGGSLGDICVRCYGARVIDQPGSVPVTMPPFAELRAAITSYGNALADHALPPGHRAKKQLALPSAVSVPTLEQLRELERQAITKARQLGSGAPGRVDPRLLSEAPKANPLGSDGGLDDLEDDELDQIEDAELVDAPRGRNRR